jgi:hypothetical protein
MVESGMTHAQIAEQIGREVGYKVSRSTVSAALHRAGETATAKKYPDELPWRVKEEHQSHYAARMLRLLGRRRKGTRNTPEMDARLDSWLAQLEGASAVVVYVPDTLDGFFYVEGEPDVKGIPVKTTLTGMSETA